MLQANALLAFLFIQTVPSALITIMDVLSVQLTLESQLQSIVKIAEHCTPRVFYVPLMILAALNV